LGAHHLAEHAVLARDDGGEVLGRARAGQSPVPRTRSATAGTASARAVSSA
jgi:hypothetical protein